MTAEIHPNDLWNNKTSAKRLVKLILKLAEACHILARGPPKMTSPDRVMFYHQGERIPVDFYLRYS